MSKEVYIKALNRWGIANQMDMATEECAELIQAVNKFKRNGNTQTKFNLMEEIADVEIMMAQLRIILNYDEQIDAIKARKIERLKQRTEL